MSNALNLTDPKDPPTSIVDIGNVDEICNIVKLCIVLKLYDKVPATAGHQFSLVSLRSHSGGLRQGS